MKRKLFAILFGLVLAISPMLVAAAASVANTPTIEIDGVLSSGEWDSYFWFTDNSEGPGTGYDDDLLPIFTGYLYFDETDLYLAFDVEDNTPNTNRDFLYVTIDIPPAGAFNDPIDALYWASIPSNPSFFGEAYLTGGTFPWDRNQRGSTWGTDGGVITVRTVTDTNRYYELKIPLAAISAEIGDTIGLKIQARGGQYTSETDPQVVNFYPDMPGGITPIRADTRVEVEGNFYQLTLSLAMEVEAEIDIDPDTLNLNSKGKWITAYIELPDDYDVSNIDVSTVKLNDQVQAETHPTEIGDHDDDGIQDLMVKFDRATVQANLAPGDQVEITVSGELTDGTAFSGTDTIRVIGKEKAKAAQEITQAKFGLSQNYPNPFNPQTTIEYDIGKDCDVTLKIYNLAGQLIKTLVDEYQTAGHYSITWYGDTDAGQEVASGVYFYRVKAGDKAAIKKMVVLK